MSEICDLVPSCPRRFKLRHHDKSSPSVIPNQHSHRCQTGTRTSTALTSAFLSTAVGEVRGRTRETLHPGRISDDIAEKGRFLRSKVSTVNTKGISFQPQIHFEHTSHTHSGRNPLWGSHRGQFTPPQRKKKERRATQQQDRLGFEAEPFGKSLAITVFLPLLPRKNPQLIATTSHHFSRSALWEM